MVLRNPSNSIFQVQFQLKLESEVTVAAESKDNQINWP